MFFLARQKIIIRIYRVIVTNNDQSGNMSGHIPQRLWFADFCLQHSRNLGTLLLC
jgi:hypothetical protein